MLEKSRMQKIVGGFAFLLMAVLPCTLRAQHSKPERLDVAILYDATRSNIAGSGSFWMQGGSAEVGATFFHGLGAGVQLTGTHSSSISAAGEPLGLVTVAFGPRYRWRALTSRSDRSLTLSGQALFGVSHGFDSAFPVGTIVNSGATSFAFQMGGDIEWSLSSHLGLRLLQADWLHTALPNGGTNEQNHLLLGSGIAVSF